MAPEVAATDRPAYYARMKLAGTAWWGRGAIDRGDCTVQFEFGGRRSGSSRSGVATGPPRGEAHAFAHRPERLMECQEAAEKHATESRASDDGSGTLSTENW